MPLESPLSSPVERAEDLNAAYRHRSAIDIVRHALQDPMVGNAALVSSFGTEAVVLLHMVSHVDRSTPVLFLDTGMHFAETLSYQQELTKRLKLTDVRVISPDREAVFARDPDGILHVMNPNACCQLRKVEPLEKALTGFDAWLTGRKRYQGGQRGTLDHFEADKERIKVNPLAHWAVQDVQDYIANNGLPRHPMAGRAFPSIGCRPCTATVMPGEDDRAGRWRNQEKTECGIHFENGTIARGN